MAEPVPTCKGCISCPTRPVAAVLPPTILQDPDSRRLPCFLCRDRNDKDHEDCPHSKFSPMSRTEILAALDALCQEAHCRPFESREFGCSYLWTLLRGDGYDVYLSYYDISERLRPGFRAERVYYRVYGMSWPSNPVSISWNLGNGLVDPLCYSPGKAVDQLARMLTAYQQFKDSPAPAVKTSWWSKLWSSL